MTLFTARPQVSRDRYDVIIAGARCAGASTAMLLARKGLRVLVVDPAKRGSDTLSTHALMRPAVVQLHRWGVLPELHKEGTPPIRSTTFHYGDETVEVAIEAKDGIDALRAPRRTLLDRTLVEAAEEAGAEVVHGLSVVGLLHDSEGRVRGATVSGADRSEVDVAANVVIGADGIRSRIARLVGAKTLYTVPHSTASIYGYFQGVGLEGFNWYFQVGASVGAIPTNDGDTCVFASLPPTRFRDEREHGLEALYGDVLREVSPDLAERVAGAIGSKLRAFAGVNGFLKRSAGPGWALVGDAGYFRDPLTAHGITDALRDAELLARAVVEGGDSALVQYEATRGALVKGLLDVTDAIASFDWDLERAKELHMTLSREMNRELELIRELDEDFVAVGSPVGSAVGGAV